jgi:signal peptidase II
MPKRHALIAIIVILLDRFSKWLVVKNILLDDAIPVLPGFFRLTHLENPGAAFSFLAESPSPFKTALLILFSVAALTVVLVLLWRSRNEFNARTVALSLVLGGAVGNLWDRISAGKVIDFLDFYVGQHHWPPFNLADSAIVTGALLLAWKTLLAPVKERRGT